MTAAAALTENQATAYVLIFAFVWVGFAVLFARAIGKVIAERDRRERPGSAPAASTGRQLPPATGERIGTRLDVQL